MADRRDQLIDAALTIAAREGIEAATVRAVAIEAGVSAGVVHYCFSDKNELLTCMAQAITKLNTPALPGAEPDDDDLSGPREPGTDGETEYTDHAAAEPDHPPAETEHPAAETEQPDQPDEALPVDAVLHQLLSAMWASLESTRGLQLLTYELTVTALRAPELAGVAQAQYEASRVAAAAVLDHAAQLAQVTWTRPIDELARIVVAAIDGAALGWLVDGDGEAAQRTLAATVEQLTSYAGA